MDWLKGQFEQSNIISGLLALAIWGVVLYLSVVSKEIPELLYFGGSAVIGFFFGTKQGRVEGQAIARQNEIYSQKG